MQHAPRRIGLVAMSVAAILTFVACGGGVGKPTVPVVVSYRDSVVGIGKVARFSNQSPNRLTITVTFENKAKNQRKSGSLDLAPNAVAEVGWLEGWVLESGETIEVSHPDYSSKTWNVP